MRLAKLEELSEEESINEARSLKTLMPLKHRGTKFNKTSLGGLLRRIVAECFFLGSIHIVGLRHTQLGMLAASSILHVQRETGGREREREREERA